MTRIAKRESDRERDSWSASDRDREEKQRDSDRDRKKGRNRTGILIGNKTRTDTYIRGGAGMDTNKMQGQP